MKTRTIVRQRFNKSKLCDVKLLLSAAAILSCIPTWVALQLFKATNKQYQIIQPRQLTHTQETTSPNKLTAAGGLSPEEHYRLKWEEPIGPHLQVYENHLPQQSLHQEGGTCQIDSKLYLIGGLNATRYHVDMKTGPELGGQIVTIYNMEDMSVTFGPTLPFRASHIACAVSEKQALHITGGFHRMNRRQPLKGSTRHFVLDTKTENATWTPLADMPLNTGAHSCSFLQDGRMYCVGGASDQMGPVSQQVMIYSPERDSWSMGASLHVPRDHISTVPVHGATRLISFGGRSSLYNDENHPSYWKMENTAEMYDPETDKWMILKPLLSAKSGYGTVKYNRWEQRNKEPTIILVGGETFIASSGYASTAIEEYDVEKDLYYCHPPLAHPFFGGATGIYNGSIHIVGGAEWAGAAATRRVQVFNLRNAPQPQPCFYKEIPVFDQWERMWNRAQPYPPIHSNGKKFKSMLQKRIEKDFKDDND